LQKCGGTGQPLYWACRNVGAQGNRYIGLAEMWGHRATAVLGLQKCGAQGNRCIGLAEIWGTGQPMYWACRNVGHRATAVLGLQKCWAQGNRCIGLAEMWGHRATYVLGLQQRSPYWQ